jgi:ABC-type uncharacterized transport system substrate-binding protein
VIEPSQEAQKIHCRVCLKIEENDPFTSIFDANNKVALRIFLISGVQVTMKAIKIERYFKINLIFRSSKLPTTLQSFAMCA